MKVLCELRCEQCGTAFTVDQKRVGRARFCSMSCRSTFVARTTAGRRGEMLRSRGDGRTYRKRNGRHEHRIVAEAKIGRPLRAGEIVHHVDGDMMNNDPSNLEVMTQAEHMRIHGLGIKGKKLDWKPWSYRR